MASTPLFAAGISSIALVTGLLASGSASAQSSDAPTSRADVRAETREAAKAHRLTPAGEGATPTAGTNTKSTKTRAQRKAETLQAAKDHSLTVAGEGPNAPSK